jgi:diguanylate cyclase (GGDEF)-like protein
MFKKNFPYFINIIIGWAIATFIYAIISQLGLKHEFTLKVLFTLLYLILYYFHTSAYRRVARIINDDLEIIEQEFSLTSPINATSHALRFNLNYIKQRLDRLIELIRGAHHHINELEQLNKTKTYTLDTLLEVSQHALHEEHITNYYHLILASAIKVIKNANKGSILVRDSETGRFKFETCLGYDLNILQETDFAYEQTFASTGKDNQSAIITEIPKFNALNLTPSQNDALRRGRGFELASTLSAPIYINNEVYAIINIDSDMPSAFCQEDATLIQFFTTQISLALKSRLELTETLALSKYDKLTGVFNRNYFDKMMKPLTNPDLDHINTYSLVLFDLDNLKVINDSYGHLAGDAVLIAFTNIIKEAISDHDILARVGGDEFILILRETSSDKAKQFMATLYENYKSHSIYYNATHLPVRFSYGIASSPDDSMVYEILHKLADARMYEFKYHSKKESH